MTFGVDKPFHGDGPGNIYTEKRAGASQVRGPALDSRSEECKKSSADQTPTCNTDVDLGFYHTVSDSSKIEEVTQVVSITLVSSRNYLHGSWGDDLRNQCIARPLGEKTEESRNKQTSTHAGCSEHIQPALPGLLHLQFDRLLDLGHLRFDKERSAIPFGVVFNKNFVRIVVSVLTNQVSWTFRQEAADIRLVYRLHGKGLAYKTNVICMRAGAICKSDGILHAQSVVMVTVPSPTAAAMICPMK